MKNRVNKIIYSLIDKTVPAKYRAMVEEWLIGNQDEEEKDKVLFGFWNDIDTQADENTAKSLSETKARIGLEGNRTNMRRKIYTSVWKYAAVFLLLVITGLSYYILTDKKYDTVSDMIECYVPHGEQRTLVLSDGTTIQLNSGSLAIYPREFKGDTRQVYLSGEAWFEVEPDSEKRFIVSTGPLKIEVLGTKFNVESYPGAENITTTLEEGAVKVYKSILPDKSIVMEPSDRLVYSNAKDEFNLVRVKSEEYRAWTKNQVWFVNQPLSDILKTIERRYNVTFRYDTKLDLSQVYTMKFKEYETIEDVMRIFSLLAGNIDYRIEENTILLLSKKKGGASR